MAEADEGGTMTKAEQYARKVLEAMGYSEDTPYPPCPVLHDWVEGTLPDDVVDFECLGESDVTRFEWDDGSSIVYNGMSWAFGLTRQQLEDGVGCEIDLDVSYCLVDTRFQPAP